MSRTIDEKVVEMKFDNSDFEKNVSESMSTLDKLKSALNFSNSESSFAPLGAALENAGQKFTAFEAVAVGALMNLGAKLEDFAEKKVKSLTIEPVMQGFDKYADKTKSVQTIMNATGKEIEEVSDQLDRLNWYTDETSYSFTEMVSSIGKFTSNGIELDKAVTAMEGVANWAGVSGAGKEEANRAMYNISQALAGGYMRLQDWKSIENANMATKEFKESVIQMAVEMGTLEEAVDDAGNAIYGFTTDSGGFEEVNFQTMSQTLSKGKWLTNDVLTATLAIYGEFTDELSKVYNDLNETVDITTSEIVGYVNQYIDGTIDWSEATEATGKSAEELEVILASLGREEYALGRKSFAAAQEAKTFEEAVDATKDAVSTAWMNTFEILFGNYEEAKVLWTDLANELWEIFAGPINNMNEMLTGWKDLGGRDSFIQSFKNIYHAVRSFVDPIKDAFAAIFPAINSEGLLDLTKRFEKFTEKLRLSETDMIKIKGLFEGIFRVVDLVKDGIGGVISAFSGGLSRSKKGFFEGLLDTLYNAGKQLAYFSDSIRKVKERIEGFRAKIVSKEELDNLKEAHPILFAIADIFDKIERSAEIIGGFVGRFFDIKNIINEFKDAGGGIVGITEVISDRLADALKTIQTLIQTWTGINIGKVTGPIIDAIEWVQDKIKEIRDSGVLGEIKGKLIDIVDAFEARFGTFWSWFQPLADAGKSIWQDFVDGVKMISGFDGDSGGGIFDKIKSGLDAIKQFVQDSPMLQGIIDTFKGVISDFGTFLSSFLSLKDTIELFRTSGGGIEGVLAVIYDKLGDIFKLVSDIIYRITGLDISKILDKPFVQDMITMLKDVISLVANSLKEFLSLGDIKKIYTEAGGGLQGILAVIHDKISGIFDLLSDIIKRVTGFDINGFGGPVVKVIQAIEEGLAHIANFIAKLFGWNDNPFEKFLGSSSGALDSFMGALSSLGGGEDGEKKSPIGGIFDKIGETLSKFWDTLKGIAPYFSPVIHAIGDAVVWIIDTLKGISLSDVIDVAKIIILLQVGKSIKKLFGSISDTLSAFQKQLKAEAIKSIAVAILAVAGAAYMISKIESDKVAGVIGILAVSLAGLIGIMKMASKADPKAITALVPMMLSAAISMILMAKAVKQVAEVIKGLSDYSIDDMVSGFAGVAVSMIMLISALAVASKVTKDNQGIGKTFSSLAVALIVLFAALELYRLVDWDTIGDSLLKIITVVASLGVTVAVISKLLSKSSGAKAFSKSMRQIATGMLILVAAIALINKVDFEKFAEGLLKISATLLALSIVIGIASIFSSGLEKFSKALLTFGKAILIILAVVAGLGIVATLFEDFTDKVIENGINLFVNFLDRLATEAPRIADDIVVIIVSILDAVAAHADEIVAAVMSIAISILTQIGASLQEIDPEPFLHGAEFFAGILAAMFVLKKAGGVGIKDFLKIGGTILEGLVLMVAIIAAFAGIGYAINAIKEDFDVLASINELATVLDAIAGIFISKVGLVIAAVAGLAMLMNKLPELGMSKNGKGSFEGFKALIIFISEVFAAIGEIVLMMAVLGDAMILLDQFVAEGEQWSDTIGKFGEVMGAVADVLLGKVGIVILAVGALALLMDGLSNMGFEVTLGGFGSVIAIIAEVFVAIGEIVVLMAGLGDAFALIDLAARKLSGDAFEGSSIIEGIKYFGEVLTAVIDVLGGVLGSLVGNILGGVLGGVGEGLAESAESYGQAVKTFCEVMGEVPDDIVDKAKIAADMFSTLMSAIPNEGGLVGLIIGSKDEGMKNLTENLPAFATAIKDFGDNIDGLNKQAIEDSKSGVDIILAIASAVPREGGLWQDIVGSTSEGMKGIADNLKLFGQALVDYSKVVIDLDSEAVASSKDGIDIILKIAKAVPKEGGLWQDIVGSSSDGMKAMTDNLKDFGTALVDYSHEMAGGNGKEGFKASAVESSNKAVQMVLDIANGIPATGGIWDDLFGDKGSGMADLATNLPNFGAALKKYSWEMNQFKTDAVTNSAAAVQMIVDMSNSLPETGGWLDWIIGEKDAYDNMESLEKRLPLFGKALSDYAKEIVYVTESTLTKSGYALSVIQHSVDMSTKSAKIKEFGDSLKSYYNSVKGIDTKKMDGVTDSFRKLWNEIANIIYGSTGFRYVQEWNNAGQNMGYQLDAGTAKGIEDGMGLVMNRTKVMADGTIDTAREELRVYSPSRVFATIGGYVAEGLALGIEGGTGIVVDSTTAMAESVVDTTKDVLDIHSPSLLAEFLGKLTAEGFANGIFDGQAGITGAITKVVDKVKNAKSFDEVKQAFLDNGVDAGGLFGKGAMETFQALFNLSPDKDGDSGLLEMLAGNLGNGFSEEALYKQLGIENFGEGALKEAQESLENVKGEVNMGSWLDNIYENNGEGSSDWAQELMNSSADLGIDSGDAIVDNQLATLEAAEPKLKDAAFSTVPEGAEELKSEYQEHLDNTGALEITAAPTVSLEQAKSALEILDRYVDGLKASINEMRKSTNEFAEENIKNAEGVGTATTELGKKYSEAGDAVSDAADGAEETADIIEDRVKDLANTEVEGPVITVVFDDKDAMDELEKFRERLKAKGYAEVNIVKEGDEIPQNGQVIYYGETESERREREQREAFAKSSEESAAALAQEEVQSAWAGHSMRIMSQMEEKNIYERQLGSTMEEVKDKLNELNENVSNTNVYLDGDIMVGAMTNRMDSSMGRKAQLAGRRV